MQKKPRPKGWGKDMALEMASNPGLTIKDQILSLIGDRDINLNTLENDITVWKKSDPEFAEKYIEVMNENGKYENSAVPGSSNGGGRRICDIEGYENWWTDFLNYLVHFNGHPNKAVRAMGGRPSYSYISRMTNPNDVKCYNKHFAQLYESAMKIVIGEVEGAVLESVLNKDTDARTKIYGGLGVLERLDKTKWSKRTEVVQEVKTTHEIGQSSVKHLEAFKEDMNALFKPAPRPVLIGDSEVVDAD